MRCNRLSASLAAVVVALLAAGPARAVLLIKIDKSAQRKTVAVDGRQLYVWPVSTGGAGYDTPNGSYRPFRMDIDHRSVEWDNAPMPYSIFFTRTGDAVHGTYEQRHLGSAVSHGCVRLSVKHAATLWSLVKREKMANTTVVVAGAVRDAAPPPPIARARPEPRYADDPRYGVPPAQRQYDAEAPRYPRRYDDESPPPLFPFFLFGR